MTVASETNRSGPYPGNGVAKTFDYDFRIVDSTHLSVIKTDANQVETTLTVDVDYSVSGVGGDDGSIETTVAPATGTTITILRNVPFTQETDLENQGAYYAETVEDALDLAAMRDQQLEEKLNRAIVVGIGASPLKPFPLPDPGKPLLWRQDGLGLINGSETYEHLRTRVFQEVLDRIAGDLAVASLIGQAGPIETGAFDTYIAATLAIIKPTIKVIRVGGYHLAGDGGDAIYRAVDVEPSHPGKLLSLDGRWWELASFQVNVKMLGARGDGVTDDTQSIQNANDVVAYRGGGTLYYPEGTYVVSKIQASGTNPNVAILASNNVIHQGAGVGATKLFLADGAFASIFFARSLTDAGVCHMTLDGNRENQAGPVSDGHDPCAILIGDAATRVELHHLNVVNTVDYGIGIQVAAVVDSSIHDITMTNVGADGFDNKNTGVGSTNNRMYNITVNSFGMQGETGEIFAGLDFRGDWQVDNIRINNLGYGKGSTSGRHGIRWENSGSTDPSTGGGAKSTASNIYISGYGTTYQTDSGVQGIVIRDRGIRVSNFYVENVGRGVSRGQRNTVLSNGLIVACRRGIVEDSTLTHQGNPLPTWPVYGVVSSVVIRDCTEIGLRLEASVVGNSYLGVIIDNCSVNISLAGTASGNEFIGGASINAPTLFTGGDGTNKFKNVAGIVNFNQIISANFPVDSVGTKTVTVAHGLTGGGPLGSGVQVQLLSGTAVADYAIGYIRVTATDATNVTIEVNVVTASATAGAYARLSVEVSRNT